MALERANKAIRRQSGTVAGASSPSTTTPNADNDSEDTAQVKTCLRGPFHLNTNLNISDLLLRHELTNN